MTSTPPPWVDDLFSFPTPPALRTLIDIAWQAAYEFYLANESYDYSLLETHFDFMFDLTRFPRPPEGCDGYPEFTEAARQLTVPLYATPEFVPFGSLGTGAYVGWLVPAPELGGLDHQVALASGHDHGVTLIGADTRTGLEFMLSWALRRSRDRTRIDRLAAELGVRPDRDRTYAGSSWNGTTVVRDEELVIEFDVPDGWRHEPGFDGIGVLAPAHAFADRDPVVADALYLEETLQPALADAARSLDAGHPATALLGLKDSFFDTPSYALAPAKPLWARAYRDLGRTELAERLDRMPA
jgi:hypothetical protein